MFLVRVISYDFASIDANENNKEYVLEYRKYIYGLSSFRLRHSLRFGGEILYSSPSLYDRKVIFKMIEMAISINDYPLLTLLIERSRLMAALKWKEKITLFIAAGDQSRKARTPRMFLWFMNNPACYATHQMLAILRCEFPELVGRYSSLQRLMLKDFAKVSVEAKAAMPFYYKPFTMFSDQSCNDHFLFTDIIKRYFFLKIVSRVLLKLPTEIADIVIRFLNAPCIDDKEAFKALSHINHDTCSTRAALKLSLFYHGPHLSLEAINQKAQSLSHSQ